MIRKLTILGSSLSNFGTEWDCYQVEADPWGERSARVQSKFRVFVSLDGIYEGWRDDDALLTLSLTVSELTNRFLPEDKEAEISRDPVGRSSTNSRLTGTCHGFSENELEERNVGDGYELRGGWVWLGEDCGNPRSSTGHVQQRFKYTT